MCQILPKTLPIKMKREKEDPERGKEVGAQEKRNKNNQNI